MKLEVFEGKTKEDALNKALEALNAEEKEIFYKEEEIKGKLFKATTYKCCAIKISDIAVGVDSDSFTTSDIVVNIGDKVVNDGINLIKIDDNNYNLQIDNNIDNGLIKIEIDENKVFDKLENPNEKFEMNTVIRFNNVYTVSYDANGGT
jgi:predicted RNA-binding protein Jag